MKLSRPNFLIIFILLNVSSIAYGQRYFHNFSGYVFDSENNPLPFANLYVKNDINKGTTTDEQGRFFLELKEGDYDIVISSIGYEEKILKLTLNKDITKNVWINQSVDELNEIVVKATKKDPAYQIIKNAIDQKEKYRNQYNSFKCNFYIKASEIGVLDSSRIKVKKVKRDSDDIDSLFKKKPKGPNMSMSEIKGVYHFQIPNYKKEIVEGISERGHVDELYYLSNLDADFNFYNNLIYSKLSDAPLMSPLNWTSPISYKFEWVKDYTYNNKIVNIISVKARNSGNAQFTGEIHIVEDEWAIKYLELSLDKKVLTQYDEFTITQNYESIDDSLWILEKQEFAYKTKDGKTDFEGRTVVHYSEIEINPTFEKRFFNNELGVKTEGSYEKDTTYWKIQRPEPLTQEEQKYIGYVDSVRAVLDSDEYKDSVQAAHNKITLLNIIWDGQPAINWRKQRRIYLAPIPAMFNPLSVGGTRVGYWFSYYKRFNKRQYIRFFPNVSYGLRNEDVKGNATVTLLYDPIKRKRITLFGGREFTLINPYDAYINMFKRGNYYEQDFLQIVHRMEIINGLFFNLTLKYEDRRSISRYKFGELADEVFEDNNPVDFDYYTAFSTEFRLSYTPQQKYIREPYEKIILGSKWPEFGVNYRKGFPTIFKSAVNFDYLEFDINHLFKLGLLGDSKYRIASGKFLNTNTVKLVDYKFQRQGDPLLYTNPLTTFQLLSHTFPTFDWFIEAHYLHRFNGVIMNKFPLIRKLRLRFAAGGGALYAFENEYQHAELFAGIERIIRIRRERFRLGVYGAASESSDGPDFGIKFSLEYFDKQNQNWGF